MVSFTAAAEHAAHEAHHEQEHNIDAIQKLAKDDPDAKTAKMLVFLTAAPYYF